MEKKRSGVTAADFVIIIILLLLCLFVYRYVFAGMGGNTYEIDYVLKVEAIRSELSDRIAVGDSVYSSDGAYMGHVTAVEKRAARIGTGQTLPDRYDLYITVGAEADVGGSVSGYAIYAERELQMYTVGLSFDCVCISVR